MAGDDLDVLRSAALWDPEGRERWDIVHYFCRRTDRPAFDAALRMALSEDLPERMIGLDVLAMFGHEAGFPFLEESLPVVIRACDDRRPAVVQAAVVALGCLRDARGLRAVLAHVAHEDEDIRHSVAVALPWVAGDPAAPDAVAALIRLSTDPAAYVRDWATFGLVFESMGDSEQVRRALLDRVDDPDPDTAVEALRGLGRRGDRRVIPALTIALAAPEPDYYYDVVEAATKLAAPELLPALRRLKEQETSDDDEDHDGGPRMLDVAIAACTAGPDEGAGGTPSGS